VRGVVKRTFGFAFRVDDQTATPIATTTALTAAMTTGLRNVGAAGCAVLRSHAPGSMAGVLMVFGMQLSVTQ
jgi:hypothetical protein